MQITNPPSAHADSGPAATILAFGDSLTAGYGLSSQYALPVLLEQRFLQDNLIVRVINAGVSGDTTAGGRARLDWALGDNPDAVIMELGANDALQGIDPAETRANLDAMLQTISSRNLPILLLGMRSPANWGLGYGRKFEQIFPDMAEKYETLYHPFFLEGVAGNPAMTQMDGLHPNPQGMDRIIETIYPLVKELAMQVITAKGTR